MNSFIKISTYLINLIINSTVFSITAIILNLFFCYYFLITIFGFFFGFREIIIKMLLSRLITSNKTSLLKSDKSCEFDKSCKMLKRNRVFSIIKLINKISFSLLSPLIISLSSLILFFNKLSSISLLLSFIIMIFYFFLLSYFSKNESHT